MTADPIRLGALLLALAAGPAAAQETLIVPYTHDIGSFDPDDAFEVLGLSASTTSTRASSSTPPARPGSAGCWRRPGRSRRTG